MAQSISWRDASAPIAGVKMQVRRGGAGAPLLLLGHDFGCPENLQLYDQLAQGFDVLVPEHPGFGKSERPQWMRSVRDLAVMYRCYLNEVGIGNATLVGLGFGGWVAAEMASMAPRDVSHLVLVAPMGIKPAEGFILDQAIVGYIDYARAAFGDQAAFDAVYGAEPSNDQLELWDLCREMSFRIAWKPYMYSQTLPHLLRSVPVRTLLVWGDRDEVVPPRTLDQWLAALPNAHSEVVGGAGHAVGMEQPQRLASMVRTFAGA